MSGLVIVPLYPPFAGSSGKFRNKKKYFPPNKKTALAGPFLGLFPPIRVMY
jgi:hypothetical protein